MVRGSDQCSRRDAAEPHRPAVNDFSIQHERKFALLSLGRSTILRSRATSIQTMNLPSASPSPTSRRDLDLPARHEAA
jgi:hypothetical protein